MGAKRKALYKVDVLLVLIVSHVLFIPGFVAEENATERDFIRLNEKLLKGYMRHVRPIANQSAALEISLDFHLLSVYDVDDVMQVIYVIATTSVHWHDKNLIWDPTEFGGLDQMYLGPDHIWTPIIYFLNSHDKDGDLFSHPTHHVVTSEGKVDYASIAKLSCQCKLDLVLFPSDTQTCVFTFAVFDSSIRDVDFVVDISASNVTPIKITEHGEWEVLSVKSGPKQKGKNKEYATASAVITIRRRPDFYYLNIYTPVFSIATLCVLTFFVPVDSGERLAYALSMHLSLSVYIAYVGDILPMASLGMPNVFYVVSAVFISSVLCVAFSALNMALRWSIITTTGNGKKKITILGFNFYLRQKGAPTPIATDRSKSLKKSARDQTPNLIKNDIINHVNEDTRKKENKLFIVFPAEESLEQSNDEKEEENKHQMDRRMDQNSTRERIDSKESNHPKEPESWIQKSSGFIDPDLIRICNTLDYCGFALVSSFLIVIVIMTSLNRKWF